MRAAIAERMLRTVGFADDIEGLGFRPAQDRPSRGVRTFTRSPNRFLTLWVHAYEDGSALFTWEFAVAEFLLEHGIQLGTNEALNLFMFPVEDERGPQEAGWVTAAMDRAEAALRGLDLASPGGVIDAGPSP
jgi:hypothetical protein